MALICGKSGTGKTMTLRNLPKQQGVLYLNCEGDSELPFDHEFKSFLVTHPHQVPQCISEAEKAESIHTIVIDSLTFLADMYVNQIIIPAQDARNEWGVYNTWMHDLLMSHCARSTKNILILAHTIDELNEEDRLMETKVVLPGKKINVQGLESYFNTVVGTFKKPLDELEDYTNDLLVIDDWDEAVGYKHVIQTFSSRTSTKDRLRGKYKMWAPNELYIENDIVHVLKRMRGSNKPALKAAS